MNDKDKMRLVRYILSEENNPSADRLAFKELVGNFEHLSDINSKNSSFPVRVLWKITGVCNCSCNHCWASLGKPIETSKLLKVASELSENHVAMVSLSGGEPLLCPDLFSIYNILKRRNAIVEILTNGSLINEKWVDRYLECANIDTDVIQISVDGSTSLIHDHQRNRQIFDNVIEAIKLLKRKNIKVRASFTATRNNQSDMLNTYLLCDSLGVDVMSISPVFPLRKGKHHINDLDEEVYMHQLLLCKDALHSGKTRTQIRGQGGFGFQEICLDLYKKALFPKELLFCSLSKETYMPETNISMQIDAHGNALPGPEYEDVHIAANVYENTISKIWTSGKSWEKFRKRRQLLYAKCGNCPIFCVCGGGNAKIAFDKYKTIHAPDGRCSR